MKKTILSILLAALAILPARALITTNLLAPVIISTGFTNGQAVTFFTFTLPLPQVLVISYNQITNVLGTNTLGFGGSLTVTPTNAFNLYPLATNGESDTFTANQIGSNGTFTATIVMTGIVTNAGGTNLLQMQYMHQ